MKRTLFFSIFLLAFGTKINASQPNLTDLDPSKLYLVHASDILLEDSTARTGALVAKGGLVLDTDIIPTRRTLHHCLGGLVPAEMMASAVDFGGFMVHMPVTGGHDGSRYVYMDRYPHFAGDVIGGQVNDTFTTAHVYGAGSIAFIPQEDEALFKVQNPDYKGALCLYDPKSQSTRELVQKTLGERGAYQISFEDQKKTLTATLQISEYNALRVNGDLVSCDLFERFYGTRGLIISNHNYTRWHILESLLQFLNKPFLVHQIRLKNERTSLTEGAHRHVLPERHLIVVMALIQDQFERLEGELDPDTSSGVLKTLRDWRASYERFTTLYRLDLELLKARKSIFETHGTLSNVLAVESNSEQLNLFAEKLSSMEERAFQSFLREKSSSNYALAQGVPSYFDALVYACALERQDICEKLKRFIPGWYLGERVQIHWFLKWLENKNWKYCPSGFEEFFPGLVTVLLSHDQSGVSFIRKELSNLSGNREEGAASILPVMNITPHVSSAFRQLLGLLPGGALSFQDLLSSLSPSNYIFGKDLPQDFQCAEFLRKDILRRIEGQVTSLAEGAETGRLFLIWASELEKMKINPAVSLFNSMTMFVETIPGMAQIGALMAKQSDLQQDHLRQAIKEGRYGTLEEIFDSMDLKEQFRAEFPTDDDFWNISLEKFGYSPSFIQIYRHLKRKKDSDILRVLVRFIVI